MRFTVMTNSNPNCAAPTTNTSGNATLVRRGTLTQAEAAPYKWKLSVSGINNLPVELDDF